MSNYYHEESRRYSFGSAGITYGVQLLILVNVAFFCVQLLADIAVGTIAGAPPGGNLLKWVAFSPVDFLQLQLWTPFSYMFIHAGLSHLFWNMVYLFIGGPDVERTLGTRQFLRFYVICGVLAAFANFVPLALFGQAQAGVIGASGAALGVLVAFSMIDPDRQFILFPIPIPVTARGLVFILIALNLASAITGNAGGYAIVTHLGGMATGYAYMKLRPRIAQWELRRRIRQRETATAKQVTPEDEEKLAEAIDNIFKFQDRDRK